MSDTSPKLRSWANPSWWNFLVVLPWAIGLVWLISSGISEQGIAKRQRTTQGLITAHEPANHNRYGYSFSVNGKSYSGWESPRSETLEIGQKVTVYYDPRDPSANALTDFGDLSLETFGPIPTLLFGIGAVAFFILYSRRKNQRFERTVN